jgi:hypothetical protein
MPYVDKEDTANIIYLSLNLLHIDHKVYSHNLKMKTLKLLLYLKK